MFNSYNDSLILKFDNGLIINSELKYPHLDGMKNIWILSYALTDDLKEAFKSNKKITAIRLKNRAFNIDLVEFDSNLTDIFNNCWIED